MKKHKLLLVFDEDSEILNVERRLLFSNVLDAENYFNSLEDVNDTHVNVESTCSFTIKMKAGWTAHGTANWVLDLS